MELVNYKLYQKAEKGDVYVQNELGYMYYNGEGRELCIVRDVDGK